MIARFLRNASLALLLAALLIHPGAQQTFAQTPPGDMSFVCEGVNTTTKQVRCGLQVPADTIGSELNISIPKEQFETFAELKKGDDVSETSAFFKLKSEDQGNQIVLEVDFADISAQPFSSEPYALITFVITLTSADSSLFPITIPAQLGTGSELFDRDALLQNNASYAASADQALPIVLTLAGTTTPGSTTDEIVSSFTFEGNQGGGGGGGAGIRSASVVYCFDDPISSMTDAEWTIICEAKRRGIVSGNPRPDGIFFFPNQAINRAEAVKIVTLGVLRSLGKLNDADFEAMQALIEAGFGVDAFIRYIDITYEAGGEPPWYAVFVNLATDNLIVHGYREDNTYRPANKINNAESYRVIVEAGRVASPTGIGKTLAEAEIATRRQAWFQKYVETLIRYNVSHSDEYAKFTLRKDFLIIVMNLLAAVGL